ncbi:MAG: uL15 family ribosomal protein [Thaumarchaeota archaeon]|nr:uL15 family ribosomal protein [Nitrososphaerota archaeon]
MATRNRKVRRFRGSRTHGWGQIGQHRKSGGRGGRGKAGLLKHKWTWTVVYDPNHFTHEKPKPPQRTIVDKWINVGQLDSIAHSIGKKEGNVQVLDLASLGYQKLLGQGSVNSAYKVLINSASGSAKEKVGKAGGELVLAAGRE